MNILWAASYTFMKWGFEYLSPMHLLFARFLISVIILYSVSWRLVRGMPSKVLLRCILLGAVIAVSHGFSVIGVDKSHAMDGALIYALEPIFAIIWARILLNEKMDMIRWISLIFALIGFAILSDITSRDIFSNLTFIGNILILIGAMADGVFSPVAKPASEHYNARVIMATSLFFATIFLLPFALTTPLKAGSFSWQAIVSVLYLAVICTSIGWTLWVFFLKKYPVNVMVITVFLQPVFGPLISHFTIGEQISARIWFGGGMILAAVLLATIKQKYNFYSKRFDNAEIFPYNPSCN